MSNIQVVQASFIQRRVQKEYEQTGRDWLEIIAEEVEKIRNEKGVSGLKRAEILERNRIAVDFIEKNRYLSREELVDYLITELNYSEGSAYLLTRGKKSVPRTSNIFKTGKGLKAYLDKQDEEKQKAYEREMLEKELNRPKFRF